MGPRPIAAVLAIALMAATLIGCSGQSVNPAASQSTTGEPTSNVQTPEPTPNVEPTANVEPTPNVQTPEPTPNVEPTANLDANVVKVSETIIPWQSSGYAQSNVIVELKNIGSGWAEMGSGDFTIYAKNGDVLDTGSFTYAYPRYLAPGQTGYLATQTISGDYKVKDIGRVEANGSFNTVAEADTIVLKTAKTKNSKEQYGDGGYITTGIVTNPTTDKISSAYVGAFYLDANGKPLGFSYTNLVENLQAGQTKGYKTVGGSAPIKKKVAKTVVFASSSY
jgi:hypothetical protein